VASFRSDAELEGNQLADNPVPTGVDTGSRILPAH
jgi:hypothetical protein